MEATPGWEQSKENAAPLARGRKVDTLERSALQRRVEKESMVEEYEKLVRPSEALHLTQMDGDPIVHWLAYIKDYQESFPSDTNNQFLLMERCTRALVKMRQYADDVRFIKVCARYAERTKDPGQIFKFLHQQKVGQNTALFWTAWAFVAEKANDFPFAEQVYKKGISKNAQPIDLLKTRHQQFQRRMSRHWLNSSQANAHLDDEEEQLIQRGALVSVSRESARRNHRLSAAHRTREQQSRTYAASGNNVGASISSAFPIFVEQVGENAENGYNLDQPFAGTKRVLETDAERKKENRKEAERWNERGGISTTHSSNRSKHQRHSSGPPPAFAVFVDEECAAQHEEEARMQRVQDERWRRQRDERTFREREDGGMVSFKMSYFSQAGEKSSRRSVFEYIQVEKLANDPLRYVRNPSQLEADQICMNADPSRREKENQPERKNRGYCKMQLKDSGGSEQCFEEARARQNYFSILSTQSNFNQLHIKQSDVLEDSKMDIDEDLSYTEDTSLVTPKVGDSSIPDALAPPKNSNRAHSAMKTPGTSFDTSLNQTAISAASSTVNEAHATGIRATRDEQTINTKFALKELSMMFSSPAFGGEDDSRRPLHTKSVGERGAQNDTDDDGLDACANMAELVGNITLDNSILVASAEDGENDGPSNPAPRTTDTPGFETMALRQLDSDERRHGDLSCHAQGTVVQQPFAQHDPLRGPEIELADDPGFRIFEDDDSKPLANPPAKPTFQIFQDVDTIVNGVNSIQGAGRESAANDLPTSPPVNLAETAGFEIYEDDPENSGGDTARLSLFNELFEGVEDDDGSDQSESVS